MIKNKIEINFIFDFIDKKPNANPIILRQQIVYFINFHMFFAQKENFDDESVTHV